MSRAWNAAFQATVEIGAMAGVALAVIALVGITIRPRGWVLVAGVSAAAIALRTWSLLHSEKRHAASDLVRSISGTWIGTMTLGGIHDMRLDIFSGPDGTTGEAEINLGPRKGLVKESLVGRLLVADSNHGVVHMELTAVSVSGGPPTYQRDQFDLRFLAETAEGTARGEGTSGLVAHVSLRKKKSAA